MGGPIQVGVNDDANGDAIPLAHVSLTLVRHAFLQADVTSTQSASTGNNGEADFGVDNFVGYDVAWQVDANGYYSDNGNSHFDSITGPAGIWVKLTKMALATPPPAGQGLASTLGGPLSAAWLGASGFLSGLSFQATAVVVFVILTIIVALIVVAVVAGPAIASGAAGGAAAGAA